MGEIWARFQAWRAERKQQRIAQWRAWQNDYMYRRYMFRLPDIEQEFLSRPDSDVVYIGEIVAAWPNYGYAVMFDRWANRDENLATKRNEEITRVPKTLYNQNRGATA